MVFLILAIMVSSTVSAVGLRMDNRTSTVQDLKNLRELLEAARLCPVPDDDDNDSPVPDDSPVSGFLLTRKRALEGADEDDFEARKALHQAAIDELRARVTAQMEQALENARFQDCIEPDDDDEEFWAVYNAARSANQTNLQRLQDSALAYLRNMWGVRFLRVLARVVQRFGRDNLEAWLTLFVQLAFGALRGQAAACMEGASLFGVVTLSDAPWNGTDLGNFIPGTTFQGRPSSQMVLDSAANGAWQSAVGSAMQRLTMSVDITAAVEDASRDSIVANRVPTVSAPSDMMIERLAESVASAIAGPIVGAADRLANI